jgi:hypothetical protein
MHGPAKGVPRRCRSATGRLPRPPLASETTGSLVAVCALEGTRPPRSVLEAPRVSAQPTPFVEPTTLSRARAWGRLTPKKRSRVLPRPPTGCAVHFASRAPRATSDLYRRLYRPVKVKGGVRARRSDRRNPGAPAPTPIRPRTTKTREATVRQRPKLHADDAGTPFRVGANCDAIALAPCWCHFWHAIYLLFSWAVLSACGIDRLLDFAA